MYTWTYYLSKIDLRNCSLSIDFFNKVITEGDMTDPDFLNQNESEDESVC